MSGWMDRSWKIECSKDDCWFIWFEMRLGWVTTRKNRKPQSKQRSVRKAGLIERSIAAIALTRKCSRSTQKLRFKSNLNVKYPNVNWTNYVSASISSKRAQWFTRIIRFHSKRFTRLLFDRAECRPIGVLTRQADGWSSRRFEWPKWTGWSRVKSTTPRLDWEALTQCWLYKTMPVAQITSFQRNPTQRQHVQKNREFELQIILFVCCACDTVACIESIVTRCSLFAC